MVDNSSHKVLGSAHVKILLSIRVEALIQDVWFVPSLKKNLISYKLRKNGLQIILEDGFSNSIKLMKTIKLSPLELKMEIY